MPLGVNPDSTIFGNADAGTTRGLEILAERELRNGYGFRVAYTLQDAKATSTDPFLLNRLIVVDPQTGDTIRPARAEFPLDFDQRHTLTVILRGKAPGEVGPKILGVRPIGGLEGAIIIRALSGLPFSRFDTLKTDSLVGLPNGSRLPGTSTMDLLVRRPLRLGGTMGGIYLDVRNLLNRRNVVAVRRDTGEPQADNDAIDRMAEAAYMAHPETIPYESSRYRRERRLERRRLPVGPGGAVPALRRGGAGLHAAAVRLRSAQADAPGRRAVVLVRRELLLEQRLVDRHACLRAFGGRDDDELRLPRRVAADVQARHVGRLALAGIHRAVLREHAAQPGRELGGLALAGGEEERSAVLRRDLPRR